MSDKPITRIVTPISLQYTVNAGTTTSAFLKALMQKRIVGRRCPVTGKVYVPPKGASPTHGVAMTEEVEVSQVGTVTNFAIVNIPFEGQKLTPPYVGASVLLDGADVPLFHLLGGFPASEARMGMRVRAVWVPDEELAPTLASIAYFEPTGEPDAAFETYQEHL
ncbi:MAG: Zn-ribbon domain-containing OB-fold protein [Phycisphaerales bacterium]|nr:Zn-ribbon domain-containing OB-fold protein [Phycisphaerales bacterium]